MRKLIYGTVVLGLLTGMFLVLAYYGEPDQENGGMVAETKLSSKDITVYKGKYCGCCDLYVQYLEGRGYNVSVVVVENIRTEHDRFDIPKDKSSCHISVTDDYFVVGHVPVEAIDKLLTDKPDIKGISLPEMPSGSPGMPGSKKGPFVIYYLGEDGWNVFMKL